jgi:RNA polymerase subunit RPABC4/transcription elongation factor Spt4
MVGKLFDLVFGCSHNNYSFPRTSRAGQRRSSAAAVTGTYVVCLECGREFAYDWHEMRVISNPEKRNSRLVEAAESCAANKAA